MRFAGDRRVLNRAAAQGSPDDLERFVEYHANFRSKGLSDAAAQRFAMDALRDGRQPGESLRYRRLR